MSHLSFGNKKALVSINGVLKSGEDANVSIFDRGFLYGDSIYEVTLTYGDQPFLLDEHLDRLWASARSIGMDINWSRLTIKKYISQGLAGIKEHFESKRYYIRIIITRGTGEIGLDPSLSHGQNLFIIFKDLPVVNPDYYNNGVDLIITDIIRNPKKAVDPNIKSGNYLNNVLAIKTAKEKGAYDAVMLNANGLVTESTSANIWIVSNENIITPPIDVGILGGITRKTLLSIAKENQFNVKEENFTAKTLCNADEVFITSSTREVLPVTKINSYSIGDGKVGVITKRLHQLYINFINNTISHRSNR